MYNGSKLQHHKTFLFYHGTLISAANRILN